MVDYVNVYKLSLITNGDFESSSFSGWWAWGDGGTTTLINSNANTGTHAVEETGGECSLEQPLPASRQILLIHLVVLARYPQIHELGTWDHMVKPCGTSSQIRI